MTRTVLGHEIQIGPSSKKVVNVNGVMIWCVAPGRFAAKAWNAPLNRRAVGYHSTLWSAVNYARGQF